MIQYITGVYSRKPHYIHCSLPSIFPSKGQQPTPVCVFQFYAYINIYIFFFYTNGYILYILFCILLSIWFILETALYHYIKSFNFYCFTAVHAIICICLNLISSLSISIWLFLIVCYYRKCSSWLYIYINLLMWNVEWYLSTSDD